MPSAVITLNHIKFKVTYDHTPEEQRNSGHPDDRLPDVPEEIEITDIEPLLSDDQEQDILWRLKHT